MHRRSITRKKTIQTLLSRSDIQVNLKDKKGRTALMYASSDESPWRNAVVLLAHPDIEVNVQDNDGKTALMYTSERCYGAQIVEALFKHPEIKVNLVDKKGSTALSYVSRCLSELVYVGPGPSLIIEAMLERRDVDANFQDEFGMTALMYVSTHLYRRGINETLLNRPGIDSMLRNKKHQTAMDIAWNLKNDHDTIRPYKLHILHRFTRSRGCQVMPVDVERLRADAITFVTPYAPSIPQQDREELATWMVDWIVDENCVKRNDAAFAVTK